MSGVMRVCGLGLAALVLVLALGCAKGKSPKGETFGTTVPSGPATATLAEILKNPSTYDGREVVLQGTYAGHCCATDFNYKEGVDMVECYYPGFEVPKQRPGGPVRIQAKVVTKGAGEPEAGEEGEATAHVMLQATGVEFK